MKFRGKEVGKKSLKKNSVHMIIFMPLYRINICDLRVELFPYKKISASPQHLRM